ncbi:hypothetical protein MNBD_BACTEROID06-142, partial [hydrothermal vent metagenome]
LSFLELVDSHSSNSTLDSEKKATSEPEIMADITSSIRITPTTSKRKIREVLVPPESVKS